MTDKFQTDINNLVKEFNFKGDKKYKLIVLFGLLGDFDSFEYAINLRNFIDNYQHKNLEIFALAIGNQNGKKKFCNFTGFRQENLIVVSDNQIHNNLKLSKGLDIGLGGWINMLLMLSGINSFETIKEVIRGYSGDRKAKQIYSEFDNIDILKLQFRQILNIFVLLYGLLNNL